MTGSSQPRYRAAFDVLAHALARCQDDGVTGTLNLLGSPGAVIHLRQGAVVAVQSPGAPGTDVLLLRSGRISEDDWMAALRAGAESRSQQAELVARGGIGVAELQVVAMMAAQDGAFATAAGTVDGYFVDDRPGDVLLSATSGIDLGWFLEETSRRLDALASLPFPVSPYRERVRPARDVDLSETALTDGQREVLVHATGRRSARDIAFATGRSVYAVTIEISRMLAGGVVEVVASTSAAALSLARAVAPRARPKRGSATRAVGTATNLLPRRLPGASGVDEFLAPSKAPGWHALPRLFDLVRASPPRTSGATRDEGPLEAERKRV
ncbi:hypothetical protein [Allokutzneria albata]|uniref:Uncharacterized protein n=1 Tax=Allokutzneria albata TaxID=211114 RepID=A0A1G9R344_ALLAB|nr:hypothetical protein [Allokutzneria albata]SDM17722.1 hypothetical protein SAMN04489726_0186 [Allokutzneria albata]